MEAGTAALPGIVAQFVQRVNVIFDDDRGSQQVTLHDGQAGCDCIQVAYPSVPAMAARELLKLPVMRSAVYRVVVL